MALSALIHKSKLGHLATVTLATIATIATQDTETPVTVAKVASVTVANSTESKNPELLVTVWTPAGNPIEVQAKDAEHAKWLLSANRKR